ncbi:hypothetical protein QR680_012063 [Steinernema hermaphroditum]|uniref:Uncharacterized protein n=1 Tax=Steinernema hermaphroditum TaxID=289476 RepID=A0AA39I347_9BILA|nr:hypothetical protein QR680_012063 [Steinernema hermaphroditum]
MSTGRAPNEQLVDAERGEPKDEAKPNEQSAADVEMPSDGEDAQINQEVEVGERKTLVKIMILYSCQGISKPPVEFVKPVLRSLSDSP